MCVCVCVIYNLQQQFSSMEGVLESSERLRGVRERFTSTAIRDILTFRCAQNRRELRR